MLTATAKPMLLELGDGREVLLPPPTPDLWRCLVALDPTAGAVETAQQFVHRLTAQVRLILGTATFCSAPAATVGDEAVPLAAIEATTLTALQAQRIATIVAAVANGLDPVHAVEVHRAQVNGGLTPELAFFLMTPLGELARTLDGASSVTPPRFTLSDPPQE